MASCCRSRCAPCSCQVDAGTGVTVSGLGSLAAPYVVSADPLETGCGLTGAGTAADPLEALPVAGQKAWAADWTCDAATNSTLHCDPTTGALWTPPEHRLAADAQYREHFPAGFSPIGVQGWAIIDPGAHADFNIPAGFLSPCRLWSYWATITGVMDASYTATATFELGYIMTVDGGPALIRPLWSRLTAAAAGREKHSGSAHASGYQRPPTSGAVITAFPAIRVLTGSVTVNSFVSDYTVGFGTTTA